MGKVSPPPYVVVVSLQKSGTNLVAHMMADVFGYRCIGHGIRDSFDELLTRLHAKDPGVSDRRSLLECGEAPKKYRQNQLRFLPPPDHREPIIQPKNKVRVEKQGR